MTWSVELADGECILQARIRADDTMRLSFSRDVIVESGVEL